MGYLAKQKVQYEDVYFIEPDMILIQAPKNEFKYMCKKCGANYNWETIHSCLRSACKDPLVPAVKVENFYTIQYTMTFDGKDNIVSEDHSGQVKGQDRNAWYVNKQVPRPRPDRLLDERHRRRARGQLQGRGLLGPTVRHRPGPRRSRAPPSRSHPSTSPSPPPTHVWPTQRHLHRLLEREPGHDRRRVPGLAREQPRPASGT